MLETAPAGVRPRLLSTASPTSSLRLTRRWRALLLEEPVQPALSESLPDFLKEVAQEFLAGVPAEISTTQSRELDRWYVSSAGQAALVEFANSLWKQMSHFADGAMPAHDARHAMFKVPAASLDYVAAEAVDGWERVGVLGALLHDHGRWAEERIFGWPGAGVVHARLSFLLGRELLERIEMPRPIKQHILMAAIRHTSGAVPSDPMPLKLTVTADRDQLYGPEIILRMAHHAVGRHGGGGSFYGEVAGRTVLAQLERYLTHRLPGPLFSREPEVQRVWNVLATFFLIAEDADASRLRFARIFENQTVSQRRPAFAWDVEFERAGVHRGTQHDPHGALEDLLGAAHIAPSAVYRLQAFEKVKHVTPDNRSRLASALHYANRERLALDAQQFVGLENLIRRNAGDDLLTTMATLLRTNWQPK